MRDKSDENWRVGERCLEDGDLNAAASRIYYAVFQAVLGWARARKGYSGTQDSHAAMYRYVSNEGRHYQFYGKRFKLLRGLRETADYAPDTPGESQIKALIADGEQIRKFFLKEAERQ